jgi:hypothetical protein
MPASWLFQNALWNGVSVAACCVTAYCSAVSVRLRSLSLGFLNDASLAPAALDACAVNAAGAAATARIRRAARVYEVFGMV